MDEKIGQSLIRLDLLSFEQAEEIFRIQEEGPHRLFGEIALELGYITREDLNEYRSIQTIK